MIVPMKKVAVIVMVVMVISLSVAAAFWLEKLTLDYLKGKFEPWLWDKLQQLEANGTICSMNIIVEVYDGSSYISRQQFAAFLASRHGAEITGVGTVLPFLTIRVLSTEVKRIAIYSFVYLLGDGDRKMSPE